MILGAEHQGLKILQTLLQFYFKGLEKPNVLFVDIALDYVKQMNKLENSSRRLQPPIKIAIDKLKLTIEASYEMEFQRLYGESDNLTEVLSDDFILFCEQFLKPIWTSLTA